ncbi:hypothetical protein [Bradyrhizobium sp.]
MPDAIENLTDEQAIRAVRRFYELTPASIWEGGRKPSPEYIRSLAEAAKDDAPAELQPAVAGLVNAGSAEATVAQATVARIVLRRAQAVPSFTPLVTQAIGDACKPAMAIDPVTGAFILAFLLFTSDIDLKKGRFRGAAYAVKAIQALPKELLVKLAKLIP